MEKNSMRGAWIENWRERRWVIHENTLLPTSSFGDFDSQDCRAQERARLRGCWPPAVLNKPKTSKFQAALAPVYSCDGSLTQFSFYKGEQENLVILNAYINEEIEYVQLHLYDLVPGCSLICANCKFLQLACNDLWSLISPKFGTLSTT